MIEIIEGYRRRHITPGMTAGQFAELLPEHLRQPFWWSVIDELDRSLPAYDEDGD